MTKVKKEPSHKKQDIEYMRQKIADICELVGIISFQNACKIVGVSHHTVESSWFRSHPELIEMVDKAKGNTTIEAIINLKRMMLENNPMSFQASKFLAERGLDAIERQEDRESLERALSSQSVQAQKKKILDKNKAISNVLRRRKSN